jgi:hypothetical protein
MGALLFLAVAGQDGGAGESEDGARMVFEQGVGKVGV